MVCRVLNLWDLLDLSGIWWSHLKSVRDHVRSRDHCQRIRLGYGDETDIRRRGFPTRVLMQHLNFIPSIYDFESDLKTGLFLGLKEIKQIKDQKMEGSDGTSEVTEDNTMFLQIE
jgi:hypothetical protein